MHIPEELINGIEQNKLIIFAGSGLSTELKLPTWKEMVKNILKSIRNEYANAYLTLLDENELNPLEILDKLEAKYKRNIYEYINKNFKISQEEESLNFHKNILKLSKKIITTNYDNGFELAASSEINPTNNYSKYNISEIDKTVQQYIIKLHGNYNEPDKCVIFSSQYKELYDHPEAITEKLKALFSNHYFLFIGFGFNDPDINFIFNHLNNIYENNMKHFVLTTDPSKFEHYKFLYPIQIESYSKTDDFINECLKFKTTSTLTIEQISNISQSIKENQEIKPKIAILYPSPIDKNLDINPLNIIDLKRKDITQYIGCLNIDTLRKLDDFDIVFIISKTYKSKLYIEDENIKTKLISLEEILNRIPKKEALKVIITDSEIQDIQNLSYVLISNINKSTVSSFIYQFTKKLDVNFSNKSNIKVVGNCTPIEIHNINYGISPIKSIYTFENYDNKYKINIIGRVEELSIIYNRIIQNIDSKRILNIKGSGGIGKTTLIKEVTTLLQQRGYFNITKFISCENISCYDDFETIIKNNLLLKDILNLEEYLFNHYKNNRDEVLFVLDNFETITNLIKEQYNLVLDLLIKINDYVNIVVTSREILDIEHEDVYSLTTMTTDDAYKLFLQYFGDKKYSDKEKSVIRQRIIEENFNNNPLAIKIVGQAIPDGTNIISLLEDLEQNFFEMTQKHEEHNIFTDDADLNIERQNSLYQSINYSYVKLNEKEKLTFELLHLFPDGIGVSTFDKVFNNKNVQNNKLSYRIIKSLQNKSLVESSDNMIFLQPIVRRFASHKFYLRDENTKLQYYKEALYFNMYLCDYISQLNPYKLTSSHRAKFFDKFENNIMLVFDYFFDLLDTPYYNLTIDSLRDFLSTLHEYVINKRSIHRYLIFLKQLRKIFESDTLMLEYISILELSKKYFHFSFDEPFHTIKKLFPIEEINSSTNVPKITTSRVYSIYAMEGYQYDYLRYSIANSVHNLQVLPLCFANLGLITDINKREIDFVFFEMKYISNQIDFIQLSDYITTLSEEEHLERMQCTYILAKCNKINIKQVKDLIITNPYTKGLYHLMHALILENVEDKIKHFKEALINLKHIKYYYVEALFFYCRLLKENNCIEFDEVFKLGIAVSIEHKYQYYHHMFKCLFDNQYTTYSCDIHYYNLEDNLQQFMREFITVIDKHYNRWN